MFLIAGLGNPGASHAGHRHNIGFMAADALHRRHEFAPWCSRFKSETAEGRIAGEKVLLLKPQTYMNRSGEAIGEAMRYYKLGTDRLLVLYDELDLAPGKLRIKIGGGAGGHNGIRSIDANCGKDYRRIRLGIGHPGDKSRVQRHVLGDFAKADAAWRDPLLEAVSEHMPLLVQGEDATFMNRVTLAVAPHINPQIKEKAKGQSHIRQARPKPKPAKPASGPMAELLKKLLGSGDK